MRDHHEAIASIAHKEFGTDPASITRMGHGICNEVYSVVVDGRDLIFRLKDQPRYLIGSHNHIPIFRARGIPVPEIVAEDYSMRDVPLAYQVQTRLPGRDIKDVIQTLSDEELRDIGREIAGIFRKLEDVPNNGKFGVLWGDDKDLVDSWPAEVARVTRVVIGWGKRTSILEPEFEDALYRLNSTYKGYFATVRPITYFGDICSKNVMVDNGRLSGLVDLDALAQGDPLEAVGRIKASWYGEHFGKIYTDAIQDALGLTSEQRQIVTMYAALNRIFWIFENGIQFNRNTVARVDRAKETADKRVARALLAELRGATRGPEVTVNNTTEIRTEPVSQAPKLVSQPAAFEPRPTTMEDHRPIVLEAIGLSKTYVSDGMGFDALKNVDLKISRGECVAIVGKSGSGKSTLMHLLACLDGPTDGYVYVDGDDTSAMNEGLKNVLRNSQFGFVFQQFFLNGRETVFENVVLPMRIRGASYAELETDADEALAAVGLGDKRDKKAKDLSGGEKQRVCIARALIGRPKVIFADEPTGNLDSATGAAVEQLLFELNRQKHITLVIVTHDPDLAAKCDRIVEMKDGQIVADTRAAQQVTI